jgi:ATP:ADP antiporter, AAA family
MTRVLNKIVDVRADEIRALWLGFLFFFVVLAGYYVIRPIRDNIGAQQFENLWWMFTVVLVAMIVANALFSMIVARMSRRRFIPIAYRFFILNLIIFFVLMQYMPPGKQPWVDGCFFVWVSVFNLFATAVFWGFMTDLFTTEQGKRLFGFIAVGGSLGGILGPIITASLVHYVSTGFLLLICAAMLEVAAQFVRFFPAEFRRDNARPGDNAAAAEKPIGGKFWDGVTHICKSPYLFGLFLFIFLYTFTSTWTYFQQSELTKSGFVDKAARTAFFAKLDLSVNTLTLVLQIFVTGRLMKFLGVTVTLLFMPVLSLFGFAAIGFAPVLPVLAAFQIARRASTFAFMRPAREVLFTVLRREDKYKAKSFIDTFGYRCGDQFGVSYSGLKALGLSLSAISYIAIPIVAGWCVLGVWLGRKQRALALDQRREIPEPALKT